LDQALHIALLAEANTENRNIVETMDSPVESKEFKIRRHWSFFGILEIHQT